MGLTHLFPTCLIKCDAARLVWHYRFDCQTLMR